MNVEKINACKATTLITNNTLPHTSEMISQKQNSNDIFVKSNQNISFGRKSGVGGVAGAGIGAITGLVIASVLTGGAATLPFLAGMGLAAAGSASVAGGIVGGAIIGDKVEEAIKGK